MTFKLVAQMFPDLLMLRECMDCKKALGVKLARGTKGGATSGLCDPCFARRYEDIGLGAPTTDGREVES